MVVNMVLNQKQASAVSAKLASVTEQYLGRKLSYLGFVPKDPHVSQAVMQSHPYSLRYPNAPATRCIEELAARLISEHTTVEPSGQGFFKRFAQTLGLASNA